MSARTMRTRLAAVLLGVVVPAAAHACAVCFSGSPRTRLAFFDTMIFLSAVPLGIIGGGVLWLRRQAKRDANAVAGALDDAGDVFPAPSAAPRKRPIAPRAHGA